MMDLDLVGVGPAAEAAGEETSTPEEDETPQRTRDDPDLPTMPDTTDQTGGGGAGTITRSSIGIDELDVSDVRSILMVGMLTGGVRLLIDTLKETEEDDRNETTDT